MIEHPDGCNPASRDGEFAKVYSNVATNSIVSVSEKKDLDFSIYPIPADEMINVVSGETISGPARLTISDLTGRIIYSQEYSEIRPGQVMAINTTGFRDGMYLLTLMNSGGKSTRKVVIKHLMQ